LRDAPNLGSTSANHRCLTNILFQISDMLTLCGLTGQKTHRGGLWARRISPWRSRPYFPYFTQTTLQWRSQDFKVGGTTVTWPKGPMRGGVFGEGQRSGPPPYLLRGLGESVVTRKKSRICTNPVAMPVDDTGACPICPSPLWLRYCLPSRLPLKAFAAAHIEDW